MRKKNIYDDIEKAVAANDHEAVVKALAKLSDYDKDLLVECRGKGCGAQERQPCVGDGVGEKVHKVHFGRRLLRLMEGIK